MRSTCLKCYGSALETLEAGLYNAARRPIPRPALPVGCDLPQRSYSTSLPLFQTLQTLHPPPLPASSPDLLPTSSTPPTASPPVTSINRRYIPAWTNIGIPLQLVEILLKTYPHISLPTPAQRAFLSSVFKGQDVYLRDDMGRGKTLAIAIAALSLVHQPSASMPKGPRIVILLPTSHLVSQVERDMSSLADSTSLFTSLTAGSSKIDSTATYPPILLATPREISSRLDEVPLSSVETLFIDEPDSMLPPLPPRYMNGKTLMRHRVNRHPPPIVGVMNLILGFVPVISDKPKRDVTLSLDFSGRRDVQTVWTSGTLGGDLRRFTFMRKWVKGSGNIANLDFTSWASPNRVAEREKVLRGDQVGSTGNSMSNVAGIEPDHFALVIDPAYGDLSSMTDKSLSVQYNREPARSTGPATPVGSTGTLDPELLESIALLQSTSPPPLGTISLAVPPEGTSIDKMAEELRSLGISAIPLTPETISNLPSVISQDYDSAPILLARRSTIPGLHLPNLHTIYMIGGLDVAGLPVSQQDKHGRFTREVFYDVLAGRLGRLGTTPLALDVDGEVALHQRVVSVVLGGSEDEVRLAQMFFGMSNKPKEQSGQEVRSTEEDGSEKEPSVDQDVRPKRELKKWNVDELYETIEVLTEDMH